jgi:hypothetical protein
MGKNNKITRENNMLNKEKTLILLLCLCLLPSCIHQQSEPYEAITTSNEKKILNKENSHLQQMTNEHQEKIFNSFIKSTYNILPEDERIIFFLGNKDNRSLLEKAIVTLGASHLFVRYKKTDEKFSQNTFSSNKKQSLIKFSQKYNINILENFHNNFYLNNPDSFTIINNILSYNPAESKELQVILRNKKTIWYNKLASIVDDNEKEQQLLDKEDLSTTDNLQTDQEKNLAFESSELYNKDGQNLFASVKTLVDQEKYHEAILLLKGVKEDSLYYLTAKSRIKTLSNLAAEELRQSAAESFNKALPTSDINARMKYLVNSKNLLTKAKELYPESDQIETINQNLEIIDSNLKLLSVHP